MNITNHIRRLFAIFMLILIAFPMFAQEEGDSIFSYRFLAGRDMFYSPGMNNGRELQRLFNCVDKYRDLIIDGKIFIFVDGYGTANSGKSSLPKIVRTRSNRVKSELITRKDLKEEHFITHNHIGDGNFVTVRIAVPKELVKPLSEEESPLADSLLSDTSPTEVDSIEQQEPQINRQDLSENSPQYPTDNNEYSTDNGSDSRLTLQTNLLYYPILMPNLKIEWMFRDRWSAALEVQSAWWAKNSPHKVYRLATVIPEVSYWVIDRSRWNGMHIGIFAGAAWFDLSNGRKGHEGEGGLVGISAGYMWKISKHLSLDAGLGVGYLRARDKEYVPVDGHFLYQLSKTINYFGPLRLNLSLVWRIPK